MNINYSRMSAEERDKILDGARRHLKFVCYLYKLQHDAGRYFLHEHPIGAASWREEYITRVRQVTQAQILVIDQCQYGLTSVDDDQIERPARKTTGMMTNSPAMAVALNKRCPGNHKHTQLVGGRRTKLAQTYPE